MNGGQGRLQHFAQGGIVKADDADILGNAIARLLEGAHGPGGDQIVIRKIAGGQPFALRHQRLHIGVGALCAGSQAMDDGGGGGHAIVPNGLIKAVRPLLKIANGVGGTQIARLLVSFGNEKIDGGIRALHVVDQHAVPGNAFKIGVQHHHRQWEGSERQKILRPQFGAQQDCPAGIGAQQPAQLGTAVVLVQILNIQLISG